MHHKFVLLAAIGTGLACAAGCQVNRQTRDPNSRMEELINQSEDTRKKGGLTIDEPPSHITPVRIHGGI